MSFLSIIKVGGKVVEEQESLQKLLDDFVKLPGFKVLVHGGGRSATKISEKLGIETQMVNGRRITDEETLKVVTMVYAGLVNKTIVASLQGRYCNAIGLSGADLDLIRAEKRPVTDVDYGFVGDVISVQTEEISKLIADGIVPVIAPITHNGKGLLLNTNADTMASELAKALAPMFKVNLVYCFEKPGVMLNQDDDASVIEDLNFEYFKQLQEDGVINEGMIPKLDNGFSAIESGVDKVIITNTAGLGGGDFSGTTLVK